MEQTRLKRAIIKEELVALTGDYVKAIILNQFIYWSERVYDFDKFIEEERERAAMNDVTLDMELTNGWIYKKAEELSEETMLNMTKTGIGNHIRTLVDAGWLEQRRNPKNKMDKTYQYRVSIAKIQKDLLRLGYALEGYRIPVDFVTELRSENFGLRSEINGLRSPETLLGSENFGHPSPDYGQQYQRLHTETTTETINNNKDTVAVQNKIESHLGKSISSLSKLLPTWIETHGVDKLVELARFIGSTPDKWANIVGTYRTAVTEFWDVSAEVTATSGLRDERYAAFYQLFPDS